MFPGSSLFSIHQHRKEQQQPDKSITMPPHVRSDHPSLGVIMEEQQQHMRNQLQSARSSGKLPDILFFCQPAKKEEILKLQPLRMPLEMDARNLSFDKS
ncbi:hypothetical protein SAY86_013302 [Trapa natans]|uniref:Uncharacterized protein n=1 Tax=Trapa natans TaxID=22666 RepID=A0AAN7ME82_TRANT|nr:hypothetical protein SAY86_013302 [Trapa natans]